MRDNSERTEAPELEHNEEALSNAAGAFSDQEEPKTKKTGKLDFVSPTEIVELPSEGKFYPERHPMSDGSVEIHQMSTTHEDILNNKDLIKKNIMVNRLVSELLVTRVPVNDILAGDKDTIVLKARIKAYGPTMQVKSRCLYCQEALKLDYDLVNDVKYNSKDQLTKEEQEALRYDYERGLIYITVPELGYEVGMKVSTGTEEKKLQVQRSRKKKTGIKSGAISDMYEILIKSIEGHTDTRTISEFIRKAPAGDSRFLRKLYRKAVPGIKIEKEYECSECGMPDTKEVGFNAEFFWPS